MATAGGAWRQAASNLLDVLKEMDIGQIFAKPVNQQIYRDYSQYVSQPMDLGLVGRSYKATETQNNLPLM